MDMENIGRHSVEDVLVSAIKNKMASVEMYEKLHGVIKTPFLKETLNYLVNEEKKHLAYLNDFFRKRFGKDPVIPKKTDMDIIPVDIYEKSGALKGILYILEDAMRFERESAEFYHRLARKFTDDKTRMIFEYIAQMEEDHYNMLKWEYENYAKFHDIMHDESFLNLEKIY